MRTQIGAMALCGLWLCVGAIASQSQTTVKRVPYHGWEGAYQLSNKTVELVFVPQIGRIMHYGYVGGPNMLWENPALFGKTTDLTQPNMDWANYGGDKIWPAPQNRWGWPPDPILDSGEQTVKVLPDNRLQVTGQASAKHGIRYMREIALDAKGPGVTLTNTMINSGDKEVEWSVWEVTQVDSPTLVRMPLHKKGKFPAGYYVFKDADPAMGKMKIKRAEVLLERDVKQSCKIGSDSPEGWLAAEKAGVRFEVSTRVQPGANYPDDGCALEIYTNPDPNPYIELELLSPLVSIAPGKPHTFTTRWKLSKKK